MHQPQSRHARILGSAHSLRLAVATPVPLYVSPSMLPPCLLLLCAAACMRKLPLPRLLPQGVAHQKDPRQVFHATTFKQVERLPQLQDMRLVVGLVRHTRVPFGDKVYRKLEMQIGLRPLYGVLSDRGRARGDALSLKREISGSSGVRRVKSISAMRWLNIHTPSDVRGQMLSSSSPRIFP